MADVRALLIHPSTRTAELVGCLSSGAGVQTRAVPDAKLPRRCAASPLPYTTSFCSFCLSLFQIQLQTWTRKRKPHTNGAYHCYHHAAPLFLLLQVLFFPCAAPSSSSSLASWFQDEGMGRGKTEIRRIGNDCPAR
jgi:hypothetical protein